MEMLAWVAQDVAGNPRPLTPEQWRGLLEQAGLSEITVKTQAIQAAGEASPKGCRPRS